MSYSSDKEMWGLQGQNCGLDDNIGTDISTCVLDGVNQNEDHLHGMFEATPIKACGDLAYHVIDDGTTDVTVKELEQYKEFSPQAKRRRMLHFESEVIDSPLLNDEMFLRSEETQDSLEGTISEMSQWVAGFADDPSASSNEYLDPSSEGWIADCFNDAEMLFSTEDISNFPGEPDSQGSITEHCSTPPECDANVVQKHPVHTHRNVVFKGRKSYMRTPPKQASSVAYPFTFIKPCGMHGDVTLKDINKLIHNPPRSKQNEEDPSAYPTSAFSGKPVVVKTKIRTESGGGSITILRTKG